MRNFPLPDDFNVTRDPSNGPHKFTHEKKSRKETPHEKPSCCPLKHAVVSVMAEAAEEDNGMEALKRTMQYPLIKVRAEPTRSRLRLRCSPSAEHALTRGRPSLIMQHCGGCLLLGCVQRAVSTC